MLAQQTDILIIGAGIAGLTMALEAADHAKVCVLAKTDPMACNTAWAQGGLAAAVESSDSIASHVADTISAGDGLCRSEAVESILADAPHALEQLVAWGVQFSGHENIFDLGQEGGHHHRRIVHVADTTGRAIMEVLLHRAQSQPNITIRPDHLAIDLITDRALPRSAHPATGTERCYGAYVLDRRQGTIHTIAARVTCLASGGTGKVYLSTTNPDVASGDGIAIAYRAGATISNLEFIQFHPTCLYHREAKSFLISEAVRGEGGILRLVTGEPFMKKYDPRAELATRDIVARAIDTELKRHGHTHVLLDISHRSPSFVRERFPQIYTTCLRYGIDITTQPIPVVPAAHYGCGGVETTLQAETTLSHLLACGEVAHTGLHGANRLASNSLTESLVMARRAAHTARHLVADPSTQPLLPLWDDVGTTDSDEQVIISHNWDEVRRLMWNYVGVVRSNKRLARAAARIALLQQEIHDYYWNFRVTSDLIELRNLALVAQLIIHSAQARPESRGWHYNMDTPDKLPTAVDTRLSPSINAVFQPNTRATKSG